MKKLYITLEFEINQDIVNAQNFISEQLLNFQIQVENSDQIALENITGNLKWNNRKKLYNYIKSRHNQRFANFL